MKRSSHITLGLVMSALVICGCDDHRRCVDGNGIVVSDANCREDTRRTGGSGFHWYYGGSGYNTGARVSGGSTNAGFLSGITRGGFGSHASSHGTSSS